MAVVVFKNPNVARRVALLISTSIVGTQVLAAPALQAPSAGQIDREIERSLPASPLPAPLPPVDDDQKPSDEKGQGQRIELKGIRFNGNQTLSDEQLLAALSDSVGQQLTIDQLKGLADRVVREYNRWGYLASATLPPQDVVEGVITIEVQEARFSGAFVDKASQEAVRLKPGIVESIFSAAQPIGETVNFDNIERAELLINDLGVIASGGFQAGQQVGETAYGVLLNPQEPVSAVLSVDNQGSRSTGAERAVVNIDWLSPLSRGDKFSLSLLKTEGTKYARFGYKTPFGYDGWTTEAQVSALQYDLVTSDFASTSPKGESNMISLGAQYPIVRSRSKNHYFATTLTRHFYLNEQLSGGAYATQSDYHVDALKVGLSGNQYVKNRIDQYDVNVTVGKTDLSGSQNYSGDQSGAKTHGRFAKLGINLSTSVPVSTWTIKAIADGQLANKNLDSSQKFSLGGASGVRAYPESEGSGVNGLRISLDAEHQLAQGVTGAVFYDWGRVQQYDVNSDSNGTALADVNVYNLSGYGLSVSVDGPRNGVMRATWSRRIGNNPNPTTSGADQDGSLDKDRFWLSWVMPL